MVVVAWLLLGFVVGVIVLVCGFGFVLVFYCNCLVGGLADVG